MNKKESKEEEIRKLALESIKIIKERESVKESVKKIEDDIQIEMENLYSIMDKMNEVDEVDEDGMKNESKFDKQLQESEEKFKSDSQNNWLKKNDDDDDIIDYVYESNTGIKKPDDDEKN